ncbi:hypothetical protein WUBG_06266, partial [Wuchereria bancrofti]
LISLETLRMANKYIYALRQILSSGQEEETISTTHHFISR